MQEIIVDEGKIISFLSTSIPKYGRLEMPKILNSTMGF